MTLTFLLKKGSTKAIYTYMYVKYESFITYHLKRYMAFVKVFGAQTNGKTDERTDGQTDGPKTKCP